MRTCELPDCEREYVGRGFCDLHYRRWRKTGDPFKVKLDFGRTLLERWEAFIDAGGDCWEWKGSITPKGYGVFSVGQGRTKHAHTAGWEVLVGAIPFGLELDHLCRVRHCVNPDHLEPVTHKENVRRASHRTTCSRGHTDWVPMGKGRYCRTCRRERRSNKP